MCAVSGPTAVVVFKFCTSFALASAAAIMATKVASKTDGRVGAEEERGRWRFWVNL